MAKFILWAPRVLTVLIISFLVIMAFDNFTAGNKTQEQWKGFAISMAPVMVLIAGIILALKYPLAGGLLIIILGGTMNILLRTSEKTLPFVVLSTPIIVSGLLFVLSHFYDKTLLKK
jgi:hypothetical protein